MTVIDRFQRLESLGLWRASSDAQLREVVVSIGDATLVLSEPNGRVVTHWSLPAITRKNPGHTPGLFALADQPGETLEIDDTDMLDALDRVMRALRRSGSHRRRPRLALALATMALILFAGAVWLPAALARYAAEVAPEPIREAAGGALFAELQRSTGPACETRAGRRALDRLGARLFPARDLRLDVLPSAMRGVRVLPGGRIVMGRELVEDYDLPEVLAVELLAAGLAAETGDPLLELLEHGGAGAALRLLSTGRVPVEAIARRAHGLVTEPPANDVPEGLSDRLRQAEIDAVPYRTARHLDQGTAMPVSAPARTPTRPVLSDNDWVALQTICENLG